MSYSLANVVQLYDRMLSSACGPLAIEADLPSGGHLNLGYWADGAKTPLEAGDHLVDRLMRMATCGRRDALDVACGMGATTKRLAHYFVPDSITGINISDRQLEFARQRAPQSRFAKMDATRLAFEDESFDLVFSVEAASHFRTRERFAVEARRVLRPGGMLVLSDLPMRWNFDYHFSPAENLVEGRADYEAVFRRAGFREITIINATSPVVSGFLKNWAPAFWKHLLRHPRKLLREPIAPFMPLFLGPMFACCAGYYLVAARKDA